MWFKDKSIKNIPFLTPNIVWIIAVVLFFSIFFAFAKNIDIFNFSIENKEQSTSSLQENNWNSPLESEVDLERKLKDKEKINILLVGRWGWNHDAPNLTDTIILASINTKTRIISMLSIPRDLYVEYPWKEQWWRINWLYAKYRFESWSEKVWMDILKRKISKITWEKIDFFVNIDFLWFTKLIDSIWWIEINIPKHFVDDKYPDWNWWYKTLVFRKWTWIFDWENALKYARSRHSTSDFDRSMRQQQVIKAVKDKLSWSYFLTSPWKIKELYNVFIKYVYTDISLWVIIKLAYQLNWDKDFQVVSSNLNDSCFFWEYTCIKWGFLYTPSREFFWWQAILLAEWSDALNLDNFTKIHSFTDVVFNKPEVFKENYKINVFNSLKISNLALTLSNDMVKYWFNIPSQNSIWNTKDLHKKSVIYFNNIDPESNTIKLLKIFFDWEFRQTNFPKYSTDNANIEIIIWEDFLWDLSPFKF